MFSVTTKHTHLLNYIAVNDIREGRASFCPDGSHLKKDTFQSKVNIQMPYDSRVSLYFWKKISHRFYLRITATIRNVTGPHKKSVKNFYITK